MNSLGFDRSPVSSKQMLPAKGILEAKPYVFDDGQFQSSPKPARRSQRLLWKIFVPAGLLLSVLLLLWVGGYLLIADDPLPPHLDGAVALQGSVLGQQARIAGAVQLIQQGTAPRILLSVPKESYWGQPVAPIAHAYLERLYGQDVVDHIEFCETFDVDSTEEEAKALMECIKERGWHTVAVVTSDYHTRRAGIIWRKKVQQQGSLIDLRMHAVPDPEFHAARWWRERRSAKTWLFEMTKLLWTLGGGS